jgi:Putative phage tail protein
MVFWLIVELVLMVATTVLTAILAKNPAGRASALGDFTAPTAEEGRVIPVVFGTCLVRGPNVTWYGDLKVGRVRQGGILGMFKKTVGYKYSMGMQLTLCHGPVDALVAQGYVNNQSGVHVGDGQIVGISLPPNAHAQTWTLTCKVDTTKFTVVGTLDGTGSDAVVGVPYSHSQIAFTIAAGQVIPFQTGDQFIFDTVVPSGIFAATKAVTYTSTVVMAAGHENYIDIEMNSPILFGGDLSGGGISGSAAFYRGLQTSLPDAYLSAHLPGANPAPAYLGLCHFIMRQCYIGTQTSMNEMAFAIQNCPDPLAQGNGYINGDANPAWMIWMWMTNPVYGLGISTLRFDSASFIAAAATLFTQQMGMSVQTDTESNADSTIGEILRHIDAVLYTDPATGLWTLKLIRADYDPTTLPELTPDDILEPPEMSRVSWEETLNEVKVKYIDRSLFFTERVLQAHESANHAVRGAVGSATFEYHGFSNSSMGQFAATRDLKTHTYPLLQAKVFANRIAWNFRMGGVFCLTWPALGIVKMVVRISAINYGALENGRIEIDCVEDIFAISSTAYLPPPFPGWTNPAGPPNPPLAEVLMEAPYVLTFPTADRLVLAMAARGDLLTVGFSIFSSGVDTNDEQPFTPYGVLLAAYPAKTLADDPTGFVCAATPQVDLSVLTTIDPSLRLQGMNVCVIDNEILAFTTPTFNGDGTVSFGGVLRGLYDTVPADHALGAPVWFFCEGAGQVNVAPFLTDVTLSVKCIPVNGYGTVSATLVTAVALTTVSRAQNPYPPGNVLINTIAYPISTVGDAVMAWADRNRVTQGQSAVIQSAASVAGGVEGNYTIVILINGVLIRTLTGQTGNAFTYSAAQRLLDNANGNLLTSIKITPVNGALVGNPRTLTFQMTGLGMTLGMFLGGIQQ